MPCQRHPTYVAPPCRPPVCRRSTRRGAGRHRGRHGAPTGQHRDQRWRPRCRSARLAWVDGAREGSLVPEPDIPAGGIRVSSASCWCGRPTRAPGRTSRAQRRAVAAAPRLRVHLRHGPAAHPGDQRTQQSRRRFGDGLQAAAGRPGPVAGCERTAPGRAGPAGATFHKGQLVERPTDLAKKIRKTAPKKAPSTVHEKVAA